jgi:hypothetical protein
VTPRSLAEKYQRYQERSASIFRADDNAVYLSGMSVNFYQTAGRHFLEDGDANGEFVFATVTTSFQCSTFFSVKPIKKSDPKTNPNPYTVTRLRSLELYIHTTLKFPLGTVATHE